MKTPAESMDLLIALHSVKNALLPVSLRVELLRRLAGEDASPRLRSIAEELDLCARHALEVVRALSTPREPPPSGVDLADAVRAAVRMSATATQSARVDVVTRVPESLRVRGEAHQLTSVLLELITNATEAMPSGGGSLALCAGENARGVWLTVTDTGAGMLPAVLARAFEARFSTKATRGRGLGLYGVRAALERHGGSVGISSVVDGGTKVTLTFAAPSRED